MLLFESRGEAEALAVVALLVLCCGSPKMQFFADCGLMQGDGLGELRIFPARPPPFNLKILDRIGRLGRTGVECCRRSLAFSTSDELVRYLLSSRQEWAIFPLEYDIPDGDSLLEMHVFARGEEIVAPVRQARARASSLATLIPDVFNLGDPFSYGAAEEAPSAREVPRSADSARVAAAMEVDNESGDELDMQVEHEEFEDLEPDQLEDMLEEMSEMLIDPAACPDTPNQPEEEAGNLDPVDEAAAAAVAADEGDREGQANGEHDLFAEVLASCRMDGLGYIKTDVLPWAAYTNVGRITAWPKGKPPDRTNVAVRCYMHPKCSLSRKRDKVTDQDLTNWLFSVVPCPATATRAEVQAACVQHMAKGISSSVVPALRPSGSGAAASSSGP